MFGYLQSLSRSVSTASLNSIKSVSDEKEPEEEVAGVAGYRTVKERLEKLQLGYLAERLPDDGEVVSSKVGSDGHFKVMFKADINAPVTRDGEPISGATLKIDRVVKGTIDENGVTFLEGVAGSGLGFKANVTRVESDENGQITMTARQPFFGVTIRESFHPNREKSVARGLVKFDPASINVMYGPRRVDEKPLGQIGGKRPSPLSSKVKNSPSMAPTAKKVLLSPKDELPRIFSQFGGTDVN